MLSVFVSLFTAHHGRYERRGWASMCPGHEQLAAAGCGCRPLVLRSLGYQANQHASNDHDMASPCLEASRRLRRCLPCLTARPLPLGRGRSSAARARSHRPLHDGCDVAAGRGLPGGGVGGVLRWMCARGMDWHMHLRERIRYIKRTFA